MTTTMLCDLRRVARLIFKQLTFRVACFFSVMPLVFFGNAMQMIGSGLTDIAETLANFWSHHFLGSCECVECESKNENAPPKS